MKLFYVLGPAFRLSNLFHWGVVCMCLCVCFLCVVCMFLCGVFCVCVFCVCAGDSDSSNASGENKLKPEKNLPF